LLLLSTSFVACRDDARVSGSEETGETGETGDADCDGDFETLVETQPLLESSYGEEDLFVWAGLDVIVSWDSVGGWRQQSVPDLLGVGGAIWASSPEDVFFWGVGDVNVNPDLVSQLMHWDGTSLEVSLELPEEESIYAIHGTGPDDVWAVGDRWCPQDPSCGAKVFHFDGDSWAPHELPGVDGLRAVWARAPDDVYVAGQQTLHYDGSTWTVVAESEPSVSGLTGDDTRLLGFDGEGVYELGVQGWEPISLPGGVGYVLAVALADDGLWVEGSFDGEFRLSRLADGEWQSFAVDAQQVWGMVPVAGRPWVGVSAEPWDLGHEVLEVRDIEDVHGIYFDSRIGHLDSLAGWSLSNMYATALNDERSGIAKLEDEGWQWQVWEGLESIEVREVAVDRLGVAWMAGYDYLSDPPPLLWRIEGNEAVPVPTPIGMDQGTRALWVGDEEDIWLLGTLAHHFDGESWLSITAPEGARGITSSGGHVYTWSFTTVYELRNEIWWPLLAADEQFLALDLAAALSPWVIERHSLGEFRAQVFDGQTWTVHELGTRGLCDVAAAGPDDVYVSGWWQEPGGTVHGVLMHWDGEAWTSVETPATHCVDVLLVAEGVVLGEGGSTHVLECAG
jgi:hypothetical protein